jgi:hypothetical protein
MVVVPAVDLGNEVSSYTLGRDGPAPVLTAEILSQRSAQQRDKTDKVVIYSRLGIPEYLLVDVSGKFLREHLLMKRLRADGTYADERDEDGGVTSRLGFRVILEADGQLRIVDANTGKRYVRPEEAQSVVDAAQVAAAAAQEAVTAAQAAEARVRQLEQELAQLRKKGKNES